MKVRFTSCLTAGALLFLSGSVQSMEGSGAPGESPSTCFPSRPVTDVSAEISSAPELAPYRELGIESLESTIVRMEAQSGPLHPAVFLPLMALGLHYREAGRHGDAATVFQRAAQILRVNEGLYSLSQAPVIEKRIESLEAAGRWKQAADAWDLLHWIYRRNYGSEDLRLLPLLRKLRRWHFETYNKETGRSLEDHFLAAGAAYSQAVGIIEACSGDRRLAFCFWHRACCEDAEPDAGFCPLDGNRRAPNHSAGTGSNGQ